MTASPERRARHNGATDKTLVTPHAVGTLTQYGHIIQVRKKRKYAKRYLVAVLGTEANVWMRHDEIAPAGRAA